MIATRLLLTLIGATAIAVPGWIVSTQKPAPDPHRLQAMADEACLCARAKGTEAGMAPCWVQFDKAVAPFDHGTWDSLCGADSASWTCLDEDCRTSIAVNRSPWGLCSKAERRESQAARAREAADAPAATEKPTC